LPEGKGNVQLNHDEISDDGVDLARFDKTASTTSWTLIAFMQRKSIGQLRRKQGLHST
jgi:hypothetical protein